MTPTGRRFTFTLGTAVAVVLIGSGLFYHHEILAWARFIRAFERLGTNAQGYPEYRHRQTAIIFVRVPGGMFMMGSPGEDKGRDPDEFQHSVTLSPFLIAKFEVTQAQWKAVMGSNPSNFKGNETQPVENVSWEECQDFNKRTGLSLPTESQWEFACRAGTTTPYAGTGVLGDMGWYKDNRGGSLSPVGQKNPNGFGLYDMHGNVYEWCEDIYDPEFYSKPEAAGPDPVCASGFGARVLRGGCWNDNNLDCRSANRVRVDPGTRVNDMGLRPSWPSR